MITKRLVAAVMAATALFGSNLMAVREFVDAVSAMVNGQVITASHLATPQIANNGKPFSLDQYIAYTLWIQRAKERNIEVSPDDVARNIVQYKQENGLLTVSDDEANRLLKGKLGIDFTQYHAQLTDYFMIEQLKAHEFRNRCSVAEAEVRAYYNSHPLKESAEYKIELAFAGVTPSEWFLLDWLAEESLATHLKVLKTLAVGSIAEVIDDQGRLLSVKLVDKKEARIKPLSERYHAIELAIQKEKVAKHAHQAEADIARDAVIFCLK
jgi:parvulin-like peptidyl-prolyl isomerase